MRSKIQNHRRGATASHPVLAMTFDAASWFLSLLLALLLRFEFRWDLIALSGTALLWALASSLTLIFGFYTHLYRSRFVVGSLDEVRALAITSSAVVILGGVTSTLIGNQWGVPRSTLFIAAPIFFLLSGGLRAYLRFARLRASRPTPTGRRALVYGAGEAAESLIPQLLAKHDAPYQPVVLVDDSPEKANRWIRGVPMGGTWRDFPQVVQQFGVEAVIVAIPSVNSEVLARVYADSYQHGMDVVVLPSLPEYLRGKRTAADLRAVDIEDLLGRKPVQLDTSPVAGLLSGRRVLVTGAGGSIGSELAQQISQFNPKSLTLVDRDETGLLLASMATMFPSNTAVLENYLVDIRDKKAVSNLFQSRRPEVVFHAAALKHLPILESFPDEAWKTNVEGTLNVLEASASVDVAVFVNISTDKAADPINVLGKSKQLGERLTAWFGSDAGKPYVSVRFGNVLGSRGSLIPVIKEQIARGGPVKITDRRATRYFMSIYEACQLVLQAAAIGETEDIMVLDMGEPVSIDSVARRMVELSGGNVDIEYVGLRPGEKLHETLISSGEEQLQSNHPKILRFKAVPLLPAALSGAPWP